MFYLFRGQIYVTVLCAVVLWTSGCDDPGSTVAPVSAPGEDLRPELVAVPSRETSGQAQIKETDNLEHTDFVPVFRPLSPSELQTVKRGLRKNQWSSFDCCRQCLSRCAGSVGACTEETPCGLNAALPGDKDLCVHPQGADSLTAKACAGLVEKTLGRFTQH